VLLNFLNDLYEYSRGQSLNNYSNKEKRNFGQCSRNKCEEEMINCKSNFFTTASEKSFIKGQTLTLILDDCPLQRYFLSQELTKSGISAECVGSIAEALRYIKSSNHIDLIISDIELSNESGFDFVKKVKEYYKSENLTLPPTIAISSCPEYETPALKAGFNKFLKKPISPKDCTDVLTQLNIDKLINKPKPHLSIQ
jgi:CheY-like chemotaxis protein